jgi:hypothetical protein
MIQSHFDPVHRRVIISFDETDCYTHGSKPGDLAKGYVPRTLMTEAVKQGKTLIPTTVLQEMRVRKAKNYLKRFPFLRVMERQS